MAEEKKKPKVPAPLQIAGGVIFLAASLALMVHRIPHRQYVAAHEDKPRAARGGENAAPAARAAAPAAPARAAAPAVARVPAPAAPVPAQRTTAASSAPTAPPVLAPDWADDCRSELGILCHGVTEKRRRRCLEPYFEALLKPCREALRPADSALPE